MEKPLAPPPLADISPELDRWLRQIPDLIPKITMFVPVLNPASVNSGQLSSQTFTVTGIDANDLIFVNGPSFTSSFILASSRVLADDLVLFIFDNRNAGAINEASATYNIVAIRK